MPYINNKEIAVHYELAGDHSKPALVLLFGFGMSCEDWLELGYVHALAPFFQVVCIDPRGHGVSTLPRDAKDYALEKLASDVEAVIAELGLESPILWGYSLGAKIALAVAGRDPAAYSALVLGGLELHSVVDLTNDRVTATLKSGPEAWLSLWRSMFQVPMGMAKRLAQIDTQALYALRTAEAGWPSLQRVPEKITAPVLLYAGENCFFRDSTAHMLGQFSDGRYIECPGNNHFEQMTQTKWITEEVIKHLAVPRTQ